MTKLARMKTYRPLRHLQKMATNTITIAVEAKGRRRRKPWHACGTVRRGGWARRAQLPCGSRSRSGGGRVRRVRTLVKVLRKTLQNWRVASAASQRRNLTSSSLCVMAVMPPPVPAHALPPSRRLPAA